MKEKIMIYVAFVLTVAVALILGISGLSLLKETEGEVFILGMGMMISGAGIIIAVSRLLPKALREAESYLSRPKDGGEGASQ